MKRSALSGALISAFISVSLPLVAQTNLVANGSFEQHLANWTQTVVNAPGAVGNCQYNWRTTVIDENTAKPSPGQVRSAKPPILFDPTDGTEYGYGFVQSTSETPATISCVLYQDIAIPPNTNKLTLTYDIGAVNGNDGCATTGAYVGLYSTNLIPDQQSPTVGGPNTPFCQTVSSTNLHTVTVTKTVTGLPGTIVRLAFINSAIQTGQQAIGLDNIQLLAEAGVAAAPTVTVVSPGTGAPAGGNSVTITGTGFTGATGVTFAGKAASNVVVVNDTTITATVPAGAAGAASVVVTTPAGSNAANQLYSYVVGTPTLGEWGMIGLTALLIFFGWFKLRRQDQLAGTV